MAKVYFYYAAMNAGKATMNLRVDAQGRAVREGAQIEIGGNDRYVAMCRQHFKEALAGTLLVKPDSPPAPPASPA